MIGTAAVPVIAGDPDELAMHASALMTSASAYAEVGGRMHLTWQELATVYSAPEAEDLLAATAPVRQVSAAFDEEAQHVGRALLEYATAMRETKAELDLLRGDISMLVTDVAGAEPDEQQNARSAQLTSAVAVVMAGFDEAQRRCAESINAVVADRAAGGVHYADPALGTVAPAASVPVASVAAAELGLPLSAGYAEDPVNTSVGNFVEVETDLAFSGLGSGLTFARTYNSRSDRLGGPFGDRWASWATTRLTVRIWEAELECPDGMRVRFDRDGTHGWRRSAEIDAELRPVRADVSDATGPTGWVLEWNDGRRWEFDEAGLVRRTSTGPGTGVAFEWDGRRLLALVHERGRGLRLEWDGDRVVAVTGSDGRRVDYRYELGRLVGAVQPGGGERRYGHDQHGLVESVTDADGVVEVLNAYDPHGRVAAQRTPFGRHVRFDYRPGRVTVVSDDSGGPADTYRHDAAGRLVAATDGHGHTQRTTYDPWGDPIEVVARGGGVTRREFDSHSRLVRETTPSGAVREVVWDELHRAVQVSVSGPDVDTAVTRLTYDGDERVPSEIVGPEGGATRIEIAGGVVTAVTDADGVRTGFGHDADGNVVSAVDGLGRTTRIDRDTAGRPVAVVTPAGRRTEYDHDAAGRVVRRRDPDGAEWSFAYTSAGRLGAVTDPLGVVTVTRYGPHGAAVELVDQLGAVTTRGYDPFGNLATITLPDGTKTRLAHDALSRVASWTDPSGGTWLHEFDPDGNQTAIVDPSGRQETFTFDQSGNQTSADDGEAVTTRRFDAFRRPVTVELPDGTTRQYRYDRCGRRIVSVDEAGGATTYAFSPGGRPASVTSPGGRTELLRYDRAGRLTERVDAGGQVWRHRHDPDGLLVERTWPSGLVETLVRDAAGRVVRHRVPGRPTVTHAYDLAGRVVARGDHHGRRTFTYDAAGRVTAATDPLGHTTSYEWDDRGHLTTVTEPLGTRISYERDPLGRVIALTDPLGNVTRRRYDPAGRLVEHVEPTGVRHRYHHDRAGRPVAQEVDGPAELVVRIERDPRGHPVRVTTVTGEATESVELGWTPTGRLASRRSRTGTLAWGHDPDGYRTHLTRADGSSTTYRHDPSGRLSRVEHPLLGTVVLHHDPDGRLLEIRDDAVEVSYGYTEGWLTARHVRTGDQATTTRLVRDDHGRIVEQSSGSEDEPLREPPRPDTYAYDPAGQLRAAVIDGRDWEFGYDPHGRLTDETRGDTGDRRTMRYDGAGRLTHVEAPDGTRRLTHDAAGRRTGETGPDGEREYTWNPLGHLSAITTRTAGQPERIRRLHTDPLGDLDQVDDEPVTWDSADPFQPLVGIGDTDVHTVAGLPWAVSDGASVRRLAPDRRHTPADAEVADPWGAGGPTGAAGIGYRGELAIDDLVWLRARAYDPGTRGFLSTDPLPPVPGTAVAANPYHYAANDPVNQLDPLGRRPLTDAQYEGPSGLDVAHGLLDIAGFIPVVGEVFDAVNASIYLAEGDYANAAISAAALIPFVGAAASGTRLVARGGEFALDATRSADNVEPPRAGSPGQLEEGAARGAGDTVTVYRVEGQGNTRLDISATGDVSVRGDQVLFLNFGDEARAQQFLERRLSQGHDDTIRTFEVPAAYYDDLRARAVRETRARGNPVFQVDARVTSDSYALRASEFPALEAAIVPGSGR